MFDLEQINPETLTKLVWADYRLAVLFTVIIPLILIIWAMVRRIESISKLLIIYWRVSSLLMITVYLMIASLPFSFLTGLFARILIPVSLWFWLDLNEEIKDLRPTGLKFIFSAWRWAVTVYCIVGVVISVPFTTCAFSTSIQIKELSYCRVWLEAPWGYMAIVHPNGDPGVLGFFGVMGLVVYILYLLYFVFIRLGKQGRSAIID